MKIAVRWSLGIIRFQCWGEKFGLAARTRLKPGLQQTANLADVKLIVRGSALLIVAAKAIVARIRFLSKTFAFSKVQCHSCHPDSQTTPMWVVSSGGAPSNARET